MSWSDRDQYERDSGDAWEDEMCGAKDAERLFKSLRAALLAGTRRANLPSVQGKGPEGGPAMYSLTEEEVERMSNTGFLWAAPFVNSWSAPFANSWSALEAVLAPNLTVPLSEKSMKCMGSIGFMAVFEDFDACEAWIKHFGMNGEPIPLARR